MTYLFNKNEEEINRLKNQNNILKRKIELLEKELKRAYGTIDSLKESFENNRDVNVILAVKKFSKSYGNFNVILTTFLKQEKIKNLKITSDEEFIRIRSEKELDVDKLASVLNIPKSIMLIVKGDKKKKGQVIVVYIKWIDLY